LGILVGSLIISFCIVKRYLRYALEEQEEQVSEEERGIPTNVLRPGERFM